MHLLVFMKHDKYFHLALTLLLKRFQIKPKAFEALFFVDVWAFGCSDKNNFQI